MKIDQLHDIAQRSLGGLQATPEMRLNIQMAAAERQKQQKTRSRAVRIAAAACACALLICLIAFPRPSQTPSAFPSITSLPLGDLAPDGGQDEPVLRGEVSVGSGGQSGTSGIWASSDGGAFPMVSWKGAYYRLLELSVSADQLSLSASLGQVDEFTTEPSLADQSVTASNCVRAGTDLFGVSGMDGTFLCVDISGALRVFQRVSFNGVSLLQRESLESVLNFSGHIRSMTLDGVGTVDDAAVCQELFQLFLDHATLESAGSLNTASCLTFTLDNGLLAQMLVKEDKFSSCGVWSCPEFLEAFAEACRS